MVSIVGRDTEVKQLQDLFLSKEAQFVALYGRRRIGKTHLIRNTFQDQSLYIEVIGIKEGELSDQLTIFADSIAEVFYQGAPIKSPSNWRDAFSQLTDLLETVKEKKVVLFFDELPWLVTKRSNLLRMLEYFWNSKWCHLNNLTLIVCGSAASWMLNKVINSKGGLHNRITQIIQLMPFNLKQTKQFLGSLGHKLGNKQILDLYMVTGGVPYYMKQFKKSHSVAQNINQLCFQPDGILYNEFERLFAALFDVASIHITLLRAIAKHRQGLSREALIDSTSFTSGGGLNRRIEELEAAGFIQSYVPYGYKKRQTFYRVIDEYTLFYLKWIEDGKLSGHGFMEKHWQAIQTTPGCKSWIGYTFESICMKHRQVIANALGLQGIACQVGTWRHIPKRNERSSGAQIDLLFDRQDDAIMLCAIKYSTQEYVIDKTYAKALLNKVEVFEKNTETKKQILLVMVTTHGLKHNHWSEDLIQQEVTLEDFF